MKILLVGTVLIIGATVLDQVTPGGITNMGMYLQAFRNG